MSQGKIVQIIGAVVDVEFARDEVPKVYDALKIAGMEITLEVQQQLGDGIVRTIALGSTDGLKRNLIAVNTGKAISVPVGTGTLGRIMDVLGNPIDEAGPVDVKDHWEIHRSAPSYEEQSSTNELLETGIKVIDLMCPFAKGGKVGLFVVARRSAMDFPALLFADRTGFVDRIAEHVHDAAERLRADWNLDAGAGVPGDEVAAQAVGRAERDRAHDAVAELLLHFERDRSRRAFDFQRVIHLRHLVAREFDVDHRADDLNDLALAHCLVLDSNSG